ncbi:hypothetical protein EYF80_019878 [Liparis tanakae]|uniref:Uncharacterized protein n=1 Tax=Liparis tanakae TaxID=230148 RepID=A0A4Z2HW36_9TELE|nr:hypothetical protein EYF80_019878 [Liparis tanakae]
MDNKQRRCEQRMCGETYLHTGLWQVGAHGEPLPHHHIRVVRLLEGLFQRLQLLCGEGGATAALFACERVHGRPVVGRVLRLLRCLLVQVVHGAEGVHGVQRVAVHPVVLHGERSLPAERKTST